MALNPDVDDGTCMMSMNVILRCAAMFDSQCNGLAHCDKVSLQQDVDHRRM